MANVGSLDRSLRFIAGSILLIAPLAFTEAFAPMGNWRFALVAWGVAMIGSAALRFCPAYTLLGISTCPVRGA